MVVLRAFAAIASSYKWTGYPEEFEQPDLPAVEEVGRLAGTYRLDGGMRLVVRPWGRGLGVEFDRQAPMQFQALSMDRFAAAGIDAQFEVRDGGLVLLQGGSEFPCTGE